jgi:restriction endonuclease S subunit
MYKLSQITHIRAGHPFRTKLVHKPGSGTRVIQMKDVDLWRGINWDSVVETPPISRGFPDVVQKDDILLIARGQAIHAIYVDDLPYEQVLAAPHFYLITPLYAQVDPQFLAWQLNQKPVQEYLRLNLEGSTTKSIRRSLVDGIPIVVPPLWKQQKIVNIYNCIRKERTIYQRLIEHGEQLSHGLATQLLKESPEDSHD